MRKCWVLLAALVIGAAGVETARAQMGFGFGGGGFGFGGGRAFGGGGFGRGGYGGGGGGRGFGQSGFNRRDAGAGGRGFAPSARASRMPRDPGARADRRRRHDHDGRPAPVETPVEAPTTAAPRRLTGEPSPASNGGGATPPAPPVARVADRNFSVPAPDERRYVPNEVVLTTAADVPPARLQALESRLGLTPLASARIKLLDVDVRRYRVSDASSVRGTVQALQGNPDVRSAQPNYLFELQDDATTAQVLATQTEGADAPTKPAAIVEPTRPLQYAIEAMKLDGAHKIANGDAVLIAVIDTGLDESHPEIEGMVADRFDAVGGAYRPHSHGTAMAGVIVAHKDLVGIAPKAKLLAIRAFDNVTSGSGQGTTYDILRGLDFAADRKAQVINMSFAGPRDELLCAALAKARTLGMIEIAAAGNAGPLSQPLYPAAEPGVIAITATDPHNRLFAMANRGAYVAAAAPGVDVVAPGVGGVVQLSSGTSIAAAEASGVVALLLQAHPGIDADAIRKILATTALQVPVEAGQSTSVIDALAAVQATR